MTEYRYEGFTSLEQALTWCSEGKSVLNSARTLETDTTFWTVYTVKEFWRLWKKAIPIEKPKRRKLWLWDYQAKGLARWTRTIYFYDEEGEGLDGACFDFFKMERKRKVESSLLILDENGDIVDGAVKKIAGLEVLLGGHEFKDGFKIDSNISYLLHGYFTEDALNRVEIEVLQKENDLLRKGFKRLDAIKIHYSGEPFETNDIYLDIFDLIKVDGKEHRSGTLEFDNDKFSKVARSLDQDETYQECKKLLERK